MSDPLHDTLGDRLRLLGTQMPAPTLPAAEIRRRADRRRHRRHALGATAACTAAALCLALPSMLHSPGPRHGAAPADTSSVSPRPPAGFTVTSTRTSPIGTGSVAGILASCLGPDASNYHAVIAVRAPVATQDTDGVVIAVNSAHKYVQCEAKGHKGTSMSVPPTFINDRLWGTGHLIEFFDSFSEPADGKQTLSLGAGHYTPDVAKITISYGDNPTQYPALMADGAFVYTAAISGLEGNSPSPVPYVHAYNTAGQEIYNQQTEPTAKQ
ncbi:hypothetical protein GTY41_42825 [Streptomyces sp. SID685]|uniref:hypothetical protein n=2 Tax=Streptomyces sp. SID685 TaxID=2690322 RepID=UPI001368CEE8|nr:hypothetical protein [Streptomyces sp. SID685]MYR91469.1 hypothetical protein [Streptomyces sp. SID685]